MLKQKLKISLFDSNAFSSSHSRIRKSDVSPLLNSFARDFRITTWAPVCFRQSPEESLRASGECAQVGWLAAESGAWRAALAEQSGRPTTMLCSDEVKYGMGGIDRSR